jgi:hypothetical protein
LVSDPVYLVTMINSNLVKPGKEKCPVVQDSEGKVAFKRGGLGSYRHGRTMSMAYQIEGLSLAESGPQSNMGANCSSGYQSEGTCSQPNLPDYTCTYMQHASMRQAYETEVT